MGTAFWIRRAATVFALVAAVLFVVSLLKGRSPADALSFSAAWSLVTTAVFIVSRRHHAGRGRPCAVCRDTPEMQAADA